MAENTLSVLKPSVNNLSARVFVRAAGLDFDEVDMWGNKGTPEFLAKDPADLTPLLECAGEAATSAADDEIKAKATKDAASAIATPLEAFHAFFLDGKKFIGGDSP